VLANNPNPLEHRHTTMSEMKKFNPKLIMIDVDGTLIDSVPDLAYCVDELSSARIWQHKLCVTFSANVNINYRLPIKVYYRICSLRHIRIEIFLN
jgi:phosphoserine phosphatase